MRLLLVALCALIGACAPRGSAQCELSVTQAAAFTRTDAQDSITARALGPACDKVILVYAIHDEEGHPVWSWTAPLTRAFDNHIDTSDPENLRTFMERWVAPAVTSTASAPEWPALTEGQTTLDQFTYESIRTRDLPMLCHLSGTARETCVFWEPAAGGAGLFLERDVTVAENNP